MTLPIHDLYVRPLESREQGGSQVTALLRYTDHLLRRFGLAELYRLPAGGHRPRRTRQVADELWALLSGSVEFEWRDERNSSPTRGEGVQLRCDRPTLVLAPFGVAFGFRALDGPAELVRLSTHEDDVQLE